MNFPLYIAKRYLLTSSKNNAINIISRISTIGIIVGAMALFVVMSVFSGLKDFSLSFINDFDPDLKVTPLKGKSILLTDAQLQKLQGINGIKFYSKVIEEKVLFVYKGKEQVAYLKGIDNQYNLVNNTKSIIYQGNWIQSLTPQVVIGIGIAQKLSMGLYDLNNTFEIFVPRPGKGAITNPETAFNKSNLIPIGIYHVNDELDSKYVFADLKLSQDLLEFKSNQFSALEIKIDSLANENTVKSEIASVFNNQVQIKNRTQLNDSLHKMLNTENTAIYLIFTLVIIMTLFTLAGAIIMMILDKKDNLTTLFNLGVMVKDIRKIFLLQGTLVTALGGIIGVSLGIVLIILQQQFEFLMITDSLAYPVKFTFQNVFIVLATIMILGFLASYIASSRVSAKLLEK